MSGCGLVYVLGKVRQLTGPITLLVVLELGFVGLCVLWGPASQRRPRFWAHVGLTCLAIAAYMAILFAATQVNVVPAGVASKLLPTLMLVGVAALICLPFRFYRSTGSPPGPSESEGGGGGGPRLPDAPPDLPRGGIPLLDAEQAKARARDHNPPKFARRRRRSPGHEPRRTPTRASG